MTPAALREWLDSLGLSQAEFARMLGVAEGRTVRRWEAGDWPAPPYVALLRDLCRDRPSVTQWLLARLRSS